MVQVDPFEGFADAPIPAGEKQFLIIPDDDNDLAIRPACIFCSAGSDHFPVGTIVVRDETGVDLTYRVPAGKILRFRPVRVLATGTVGTFYGWY